MNTGTNNVEFKIVLTLAAAVTIFLYIKYLHFKKRCRTCGKWNVVKIIKRELVSRDETSIKKTLIDTRKDGHGKVLETLSRQVYIPGTKEKFIITTLCENCKHQARFYKTIIREK